MKALIKIGYACNENCTFCHTLQYREINAEPPEIYAKIDRAKALGHSMVVFSGGEPTMFDEVEGYSTRVFELGLALGFVTNGRRFAYPEFTDAMLARNLQYVYLSLHGGRPKVHNSLVRAHAFDETFQGVKNLHGKIAVLTVNCVVTRRNCGELRDLVDLLLPFEQLTIKFSMTAPKGGGEKAFEHVVPKVEACAEAVLDAIEYGQSKVGDGPGPRFAHDGIPFCLVRPISGLYDDLRTNHFRTMCEVGEPDFYPVDDIIKVQPDQCDGCALRGPCPGLFRGYLAHYPEGAEVLEAETGPRPNSFNYVPTRDIRRKPGAPCPLKGKSVTSYDRGRSLFLRLRDRLRVFETRTRDFSDVEIATNKWDRGQLYMDISKKLAPDDFAKDFRHLSLSSECQACPQLERCPGTYLPSKENLFLRDDAHLKSRLAELRGNVLDIGAGHGPYWQILAGAAEAGELTYLAWEPDPHSSALLKRRAPWAEVSQLAAEEGSLGAGSLDHVLLLRSYNHLLKPKEVLEKVCGLLKPGGELLLVDNVEFGLLRQPSHARAAEAGPGEMEHFRNATSEQVHKLASELPLELLEKQDIAPHTSNQWLLRYRRSLARTHERFTAHLSRARPRHHAGGCSARQDHRA